MSRLSRDLKYLNTQQSDGLKLEELWSKEKCTQIEFLSSNLHFYCPAWQTQANKELVFRLEFNQIPINMRFSPQSRSDKKTRDKEREKSFPSAKNRLRMFFAF